MKNQKEKKTDTALLDDVRTELGEAQRSRSGSRVRAEQSKAEWLDAAAKTSIDANSNS